MDYMINHIIKPNEGILAPCDVEHQIPIVQLQKGLPGFGSSEMIPLEDTLSKKPFVDASIDSNQIGKIKII